MVTRPHGLIFLYEMSSSRLLWLTHVDLPGGVLVAPLSAQLRCGSAIGSHSLLDSSNHQANQLPYIPVSSSEVGEKRVGSRVIAGFHNCSIGTVRCILSCTSI